MLHAVPRRAVPAIAGPGDAGFHPFGVGGIILFSYDSLADSTHGPGDVSRVGRATLTTSQQ